MSGEVLLMRVANSPDSPRLLLVRMQPLRKVRSIKRGVDVEVVRIDIGSRAHPGREEKKIRIHAVLLHAIR